MPRLALGQVECQISPGPLPPPLPRPGADPGAGRMRPWTSTRSAPCSTPEGQRLLQRAGEVYEAESGDALRTVSTLRRGPDGASGEAAAAALTQVELRRRAVAKLGATLAGRMYFTPDGLEQATRLRVAEHRAARIAIAEPSLGARPGLRHRWRPGGLRARRTHGRGHRPRPPPGRGGPRQPRRPRAGGRGPGRGGRGRGHVGLRSGLRRPCPSYGGGAGLRRRRLVTAVVVRRDSC